MNTTTNIARIPTYPNVIWTHFKTDAFGIYIARGKKLRWEIKRRDFTNAIPRPLLNLVGTHYPTSQIAREKLRFFTECSPGEWIGTNIVEMDKRSDERDALHQRGVWMKKRDERHA